MRQAIQRDVKTKKPRYVELWWVQFFLKKISECSVKFHRDEIRQIKNALIARPKYREMMFAYHISSIGVAACHPIWFF